MRIKVDNKTYPSKKVALKELLDAMVSCEGSEAERMVFAFVSIMQGCTVINTYKEIAV